MAYQGLSMSQAMCWLSWRSAEDPVPATDAGSHHCCRVAAQRSDKNPRFPDLGSNATGEGSQCSHDPKREMMGDVRRCGQRTIEVRIPSSREAEAASVTNNFCLGCWVQHQDWAEDKVSTRCPSGQLVEAN